MSLKSWTVSVVGEWFLYYVEVEGIQKCMGVEIKVRNKEHSNNCGNAYSALLCFVRVPPIFPAFQMRH